MTTLPHFPMFDFHSEPSSVGLRWKKWQSRFDNYLQAFNIEEDKQKRALLLHHVGPDVFDIFDTLPETGEDYTTAVRKLDAYFCPKANPEYETYLFRQTRQREDETLDAYHTRLRQIATKCEFTNVDKEIKSQIILKCSSSCKMALRDATMTLQQLLDAGRAQETADKQAAGIEEIHAKSSNSFKGHAINKTILNRDKQRHFKTKNIESLTCNNCGGHFPHDGGQKNCPAKGKTCKGCGKLNHFQKCCRSTSYTTNFPNPAKPKFQKLKQKVNTVHTDDIASKTHPETSTSSDEDYLYVIHTVQHSQQQPQSQVEIAGVPVKVVIDSGTSVNIVDDTAYQNKTKDRIKKKHQMQRCSHMALPLHFH